ncbi:MAG: putative membrane-bound dehydrogenase-like protein [Verrucomicrobiales bacterium]
MGNVVVHQHLLEDDSKFERIWPDVLEEIFCSDIFGFKIPENGSVGEMQMMLKRFLFLAASILPAAAGAQVFDPKAVEPENVPTNLFVTEGDLEVTLWANSPLLFNPTNIDIDHAGRIWVAEGVRYRKHHERQPEGDRIVVLEDTDGDGKADSSHVFVQEEALVAPLGVAVIDNKIVVSQPPDLIVYTDVDRDLRFDPAKDKREVILTGFHGKNHDHSLHSVTVGPDSKWYWNSGNCGGKFTDADGRTWNICGPYAGNPIGPWQNPEPNTEVAGKPSADGHVYVGGFTARMNPDATGVEIIGHNYRNSYEQSVTSFGDVFQNDNDDPPACRLSFVPRFANFGFASNDGTRDWRADQRPGQLTAVAEWRQENPGSSPAANVYGGGSPTGNVFYENGALGDDFRGLFLACEPGRNVVFGVRPKPNGAGYDMDHFDFLTTNVEKKFVGSDFIGGSNNLSREVHTQFRPSDVAVGPDGAIYVSDWYDGRVGGHQDLDESCSGAIYRIAPKGFKPKIPEFDLATLEGAIEALRSPAVNVRELGRAALREKGADAIPAVEQLLRDENPYIAARGIWMLSQLGSPQVASIMNDSNASAMNRIAAFRSHPLGVAFGADHLTKAEDPAIRREFALALRDVPFEQIKGMLLELARGYDSKDRAYLEALGTACTGKEAEAYSLFAAELKDSEIWGDLAWRLHVPPGIEDAKTRALDSGLTSAERKQALDQLAFTPVPAAADAVIEIAALAGDDPIKGDAVWWLLNRVNNDWSKFDLLPVLKERGIYDPEKIEFVEAVLPEPPAENPLSVENVLKLEGDLERGKLTVQRCVMCHQMGGLGVVYGPALDGWGKGQTREVIATSIIDPSADIAHGFKGTEIKTKDGKRIQGLLIGSGDPKIIRSMGGLTQIVPQNRIEKQLNFKRSLMLSAGQLGMTEQDVADLVAFLKEN